MNDELKAAREFWAIAQTYPTTKEEVYPDHARAHGFDQAKGKVLEYGCGGGSDTMSLLRRGAEVWYADIVHGNVELTHQRVDDLGHDEIAHPVFLDETTPLPFSNNFFNMVTCHGVAHHIVDPKPLIEEFHRVLAPAGGLYLMLYTEKLHEYFKQKIGELVVEHGISENKAFAWCTDAEGSPWADWYTEERGRALLEECGFNVKDTVEYSDRYFRTFQAVRSP